MHFRVGPYAHVIWDHSAMVGAGWNGRGGASNECAAVFNDDHSCTGLYFFRRPFVMPPGAPLGAPGGLHWVVKPPASGRPEQMRL